jgi:hypothetical protein
MAHYTTTGALHHQSGTPAPDGTPVSTCTRGPVWTTPAGAATAIGPSNLEPERHSSYADACIRFERLRREGQSPVLFMCGVAIRHAHMEEVCDD